MPIDYSKWKTIEISDDEDDTHPNIDTPSLFRWRHQARMERMDEQKQAKEEVETEKKKVDSKIKEVETKLKDANISEKEKIALELEKQKIKEEEEKYLQKEKELEEKERLQPWNVDTIAHTGWSKSRINKVGSKQSAEDEQKPADDEEVYKSVVSFFDENDELLQQLGMLEGFQKMEEFLLEHPHLCSENATNWLTIEALNRGIEMEYEKMDRVAENCITLQYLLELAKSLRAVASNTNVIRNFFKKLNLADPSYMQMYRDEVDAFRERLRKRAKDKRETAINEAEADAKAKRIAESPGGLDPQEVFDSLPEEMQEAFQTQSIPKMYEVAEKMDAEVFNYHLQRCISSGLWIPNAKEMEEKKAQEAKEESEGVKEDITSQS